ncbi:MAG: tetratricopeptide repeat protein, partial [Bacteroidota bacterium]
MKKVLISVIMTICTLNLFCQGSDSVDSLLKKINDINIRCPSPCPEDTFRIEAYYNSGMMIYRQNPDSALSLWRSAMNYATAYINESEGTESAKKTIKQYLSLTYNNIGFYYINKGSMVKALEYYYMSLDIAENLGYKKDIAKIYSNIGSVMDNQGNVIKGIEYFTKSLTLYKEIGDTIGQAIPLNNLGNIYYNMGDIPRALDCYQQSIKIRKESGDSLSLANPLNNIGFIYKDQGDYEKALEYYDRSLMLRKVTGDRQGIAYLLLNISFIYKLQGDDAQKINNQVAADSLYKIALENLMTSLIILEELGDKRGMSYSMNNIGVLYRDIASMYLPMQINSESQEIADSIYNKSLEYLSRSLGLRTEISDKVGIVGSYQNLGLLYQKQNNIEKVREYAELSYFISKEINYKSGIKSAAGIIKEIYIVCRELFDADTFITEEMEITCLSVNNNFATLPESGQEKYFKTLTQDFDNFYSYAYLRNKTDSTFIKYVFDITMQNKGIMLKSSTALRNIILSSGDQKMIEDYDKWIALKKQLARMYAEGKNTKELEIKADEIEKELVKTSDIFSDYSKLQKMSWQQVKYHLEKNEAVIEFVCFNYKDYQSEKISDYLKFTDSVMYCAMLLKYDGTSPVFIPLFEEKELSHLFCKKTGWPVQQVEGLYGKGKNNIGDLYQLIWEPIEKYLQGIKTVYISPAGLLHKISFAAISDSENVFLCDRYQINTITAISELTENKSESKRLRLSSAIVLGGIDYNCQNSSISGWEYLEGTKIESEKIFNVLRKSDINVELYSGKNATELLVKQKAGLSSLMHIATHGFFFSEYDENNEETTDKSHYERIRFRGKDRNYA